MIVEYVGSHDYLRVVRDGFDPRKVMGHETEFSGPDPLFDREDGTQVGLGLFDASAWSPAAWWTLPGRSDVPRDLFNAVAEWLGARERTEGER